MARTGSAFERASCSISVTSALRESRLRPPVVTVVRAHRVIDSSWCNLWVSTSSPRITMILCPTLSSGELVVPSNSIRRTSADSSTVGLSASTNRARPLKVVAEIPGSGIVVAREFDADSWTLSYFRDARRISTERVVADRDETRAPSFRGSSKKSDVNIRTRKVARKLGSLVPSPKSRLRSERYAKARRLPRVAFRQRNSRTWKTGRIVGRSSG